MYTARRTSSFAAALLLTLSAAGCLWSKPPSDRALEERFRAHEADFNRLVLMFQEDTHLGSVRPDAAYLPSLGLHRPSPKADIPPQRQMEYRDLLKRHGLISIYRGDRGIYLEVFEREETRWKGYMYAESPPNNLFSTLDDDKEINEAPPTMVTTGHKRLTDKWYLYLSVLTG